MAFPPCTPSWCGNAVSCLAKATRLVNRETFALHQQAPSEHISPSPHCHPLGTKWVGLKRLDHLELSEQSSLGSAAPHPASGVTSAHQLTHLVADWHQSTCWVGLVKTKFVDPNTYQLPCKNHLDKKNRKHTNASYSPTTAVKVADLGRFGAGGHCEEVDNQRHGHLIVPRILPVANKCKQA